MIHYLPAIHSDCEGFERLGKLAAATKDLFAGELELDMSGVDSIDANMAAPLAAILARVADEFNIVEIVAVRASVERILRESRFLTNFRYELLDGDSHVIMPFRRLRLSDEGAFEEYVSRQLGSTHIHRITDGASRIFKRKIFEVYQNAVIHSKSKIGIFVSGQFFPRQNRLNFTVADAGIGIRGAVRRYFKKPRIGSVPALKWALEPSNTTMRGGPRPGGLGFQFLQDLSRMNKGKFQIASRFGFYEFDGSCEFDDNRGTFRKMSRDFPGTAVTIMLNTADAASWTGRSR